MHPKFDQKNTVCLVLYPTALSLKNNGADAESMSEESYDPHCLPSGGYVSGSKLLQSVFCKNFVSPGIVGCTVNVNEMSEDRIVQNWGGGGRREKTAEGEKNE